MIFYLTMSWEFEKYEKNSTKQDSSSSKFFKGQSPSDSLVRELVQNSLDAKDNSIQYPVKMTFEINELDKSYCQSLELEQLNPHLKACNINMESTKKIKFIAIEDFNTTGLKGANLKAFFQQDNITGKTKGGGSHGIGKAVFPECSKIKTFFTYSIYKKNQAYKKVFKARAVLKSHSLDRQDYRPWGINEIETHNNEFIKKVFKRKSEEKGLSMLIPYVREDIKKSDLEESIINQYYMPIIYNELHIKLNKETIDSNRIYEKKPNKLDILKEKDHLEKLPLNISKENWKAKKSLPDIFLKKIKKIMNKDFDDKKDKLFFCIQVKIELPKKSMGTVHIFIKKNLLQKTKETDIKSKEKIDFWRDNILINKAYSKSLPQDFSVIVLTKDDALNSLLRKLEDPGHTQWETGTIPDEIKEEYGKKRDIKDLVQYIKRLPHELIRHMHEAPRGRDKSLLSRYFPKPSKSDKNSSTNGKAKYGKPPQSSFPSEPSFQDFNYITNKKGTGFSLTLKDSRKHPQNVSISVAYGTNIGDAFKNYEEADFCFGKNIKLVHQGSKELKRSSNSIQYEILNKNFKASFSGFDPERELKIEIR